MCAPAAGPSRRIREHDGAAGARDERVGAENGRPGNVVLRHQEPDRVEVAADHGCGRPGHRVQFGADGARDVVDVPVLQPRRTVCGDRTWCRLLQGVVGEEPVFGAGKFGGRLSPQQHGLHQQRHV